MISVVIPTFNQENLVEATIRQLNEHAYTRLIKEIIVVDAGSSDNTLQLAKRNGAAVLHSIRKNKAAQFNLGAQHATGKILYFITPGSLVPEHFSNQIVSSIQKGCSAGAFAVKYERKHWILQCITKLSQIKNSFARLEEQSLFVMKELFEKAGKFREDLLLFEDLELMNRLRRYSGFTVLNSAILSCEQKHANGNMLRLQAADFITRFLYLAGYSTEKLPRLYNSLTGANARSRQNIADTFAPSYR